MVATHPHARSPAEAVKSSYVALDVELTECKCLATSRLWKMRPRGVCEGKLAGVTGLEPATSAVTGQRSEPVELHPHPRCVDSPVAKTKTRT